MAFTAATIAAEEYPSCWVRIPAFAAATAVGVSRVASDQHWVGDVLAGGLVGVGVGHGIYTLHRKATKSWRLSSAGNGITLAYSFQ